MEQNENSFAAEPATDEPGSPPNVIVEDEGPVFATEEAQAAYWQGVTHGIRCAKREPGHPHMPANFTLDLTRDGASSGLVSGKLLEAWPHNPADASARAPRHDGWDPAKERIYIAALADTGVVADACRASGMSRDAAYAYRRRASGRAFALAWDAAILISRGAVSDDVMSRSRHGVIERIYRNGELWGERHRYDNRLTMAVLTRLDRLAEGLGENAPVIRAVAQEFDRFLDILPEGIEGAEAFLSARFPAPGPSGEPRPVEEPPACWGGTAIPGTEQALLARLGAYEDFGVGLPVETDFDGLDPDEMESWTDEQWQRAEFGGFLGMLGESEWPQAARVAGPDEPNGMCKLRKLYVRYNPPPAEHEGADDDDFAGCSVWEADEDEWRTDFPPPEGFDGWEEGEPGDENYRRALTEREMHAIGVDEQSESEAEERALCLAEQQAARDRYFGIDGMTPAGEADKEGE